MSKSLGQQLFELRKEYRKLKNLPYMSVKWNDLALDLQIDWRGYAKTQSGKMDFIFYRHRIAMSKAGMNWPINVNTLKKKSIRYLNRPNV